MSTETQTGYEVAENQIQNWILSKGLPEAKILARTEIQRIRSIYGKKTPDYIQGSLDALLQFVQRHRVPLT